MYVKQIVGLLNRRKNNGRDRRFVIGARIVQTCYNLYIHFNNTYQGGLVCPDGVLYVVKVIVVVVVMRLLVVL